jgi:hypothetical protein
LKLSLFLSLFPLCAIAMMVACQSGHPAEKWVIPNGYVGWLRLDYSVKGTPELPTEHGRLLVRIPPSGRMQTSSLTIASLDRNEYYYEDSDGRHRLIFSWPRLAGYAIQHVYRETHADPRARRLTAQFECVFVGTPSDFKNQGDCSAWELGEPKPPAFPKRGAERNRHSAQSAN